jgi:hypothetical protein
MAAAVKTAAAEATPMKTTTTEAAFATTVASGPSCVSQGDRCDAD